MRLKQMKVTCVLMLAASSLAGCSLWTDRPSSTAPGKKEITLLVSASADKRRIAALENGTKAFEAANPGVTATVEKLDSSKGFRTALLERTKASNPVDLIFTPYDPVSIEQKLFADLLPMFKADKRPTDDLYEKLVDIATVNGKLIGLPLTPLPLAVFYNKEWFDKAGLPYPDKAWTWDQFLNQSIALQTANRVEGKESYGSVVPLDLHVFESLAQSTGQSIVAPEGNRISGYLNSQPVAASFAKLLNHMNTTKASKPVSAVGNPVYNELRALNAGMGISVSNMLYPLETNAATAGKFGIAPLPFMEKGSKANAVYFNLLAVTEQSKQKELAWQFMKDILLNPDSAFQKEWGQQDMLSVKSAAAKSGQLSMPGMDVLVGELDYAVQPIQYRNAAFSGIKLSDQGLMTAKTEAEVMTALTALAGEVDKQLLEKK